MCLGRGLPCVTKHKLLSCFFSANSNSSCLGKIFTLRFPGISRSPVPANRFRDRNQRFNLRSIPSPFRFPASSQRGNTKNNNPTSIPSFSHSLTTSLFNLGFQNLLLRFLCVARFNTCDSNLIYCEFSLAS